MTIASDKSALLEGADITVVSIPVTDQERALRFYTESLGFELVADAEFGGGLRWLQLSAPGARCSIALVNWFDEMPAGAVQGLVLTTPDVQRDYAALKARGVQFDAPPVEEFFGTHTEFTDPDGNGWTLLQDPA